jgi:hypothetical protein
MVKVYEVCYSGFRLRIGHGCLYLMAYVYIPLTVHEGL